MKKVCGFLRRNCFMLAFLVIFIGADLWLTAANPVIDYDVFWRNDFELTLAAHPEKVWDRVIFGSSELVSGYLEEESSADYVNLGMDYGLVADLEELLEDDWIDVGSDLVLALNWGALYDGMDTCPTYMWHKDWYEPYFYFERDRIGWLLQTGFENVLNGEPFCEKNYVNQSKALYYGRLSQEELDVRSQKLAELYLDAGTEIYAENLAALGRVFEFCEERGLRVRVCWLPDNPDAPLHPVNTAVKELTRGVCEGAGVEFFDMCGLFGAECFYDTGHLNAEVGAIEFTEVLDKWLLS